MKHFILAVLVSLNLQGFAQGIEFRHGTWAEIKAMAQKENKLIFVDFYTDWCAPCKYMSANIFPLKEAGDFYNANFISVKIDAEKGEGPALRQKYGIAGYPTLVFTNYKEETVYKIVGSSDVQELLAQGKLALEPQSDYAVLAERFKKDALTKEEMLRFLHIEKAKGDDKATSKVFDAYLAKFPATDAAMFGMIKDNVRSSASSSFKYLEANRKAFSAAAGEKEVDAYIRDFLIKEVQYSSKASDAEYAVLLKDLKAKLKLSEKELMELAAARAYETKDEAAYMKASTALVEKYYYNDDHELSNTLGGAYRFVKEKQHILVLKKWAERALAIKDNSLNAMTLAFIYDMLQDKTNALKYADHSLAASIRDGDGYAERIKSFRKEIETGKK